MVLQRITEFHSYSLFPVILILLCLCLSPTLPVACRVHDVFRSFFIQGRGGGCGGAFVSAVCGIFSPGKIGGNVDEAKLLLPVPEENCNNHFVCPKEHRDLTMSIW